MNDPTNRDQTIARLREEIPAIREAAQQAADLNELLSAEPKDREEALRSRDETIARLQARVREFQQLKASNESLTGSLSSRLEEKEAAIETLSLHLKKKEQALSMLSEELAAKVTELQKITGTSAWRFFTRYGQFKYRYLLPLYKLLGLPPYDKKRVDGNQIMLLPLPHSYEAAGSAILHQGAARGRAGLTRQGPPYTADVPNAYDVICFSIIDWDFRFQRPQQLMSRFAAAGHRVFYIAQRFHSSGPAYSIREKRKNVYEVSLRGPDRIPYKDVLDDRARAVLLESLDELRRDLSMGATVAFVQLPFWWPLVNKASLRFAWPIVYDCMDHHAGFSTNKQEMLDQERDLVEAADLVVVSSDFLEARFQGLNPNVLMARNGCEYEHFAKTAKADNKRKIIGYYGAIADWFDADLVAELARRRPDWDFVLVGSTFSADVSRLSKLSNVSLPGEKIYAQIPDWLGRFDVAIIPFKRTQLTEATNPVKAYEILAAGKPLVSVPIPEMAALAPLVRLALTAEEFEKEIQAALDEDQPELIAKRREFAQEHTWEKRHEMLVPAIRDVFPKASIIIVTFNNVHLNRLCLESLYAYTEWPNFEVIVVDNASADGTVEYLKQAEATLPNLRVILNDENLGFASANNIGLKLATGEHLVLLNNDTVLTRGWLSTLIRHLHTDPEIGIIGPVTNEIGNEAKVQVGYGHLDEMGGWAASFVRENDSRLFPIHVLAMFCVAMRRAVLDEVGLLDENFQIGMFEDDDYTRRVVEKGYKVVCARDSFVHHAGGASFKLLGDAKYLDIFQKNRRVYEEKWGLWEPHLDNKDRERIPDLSSKLRKIIRESGVPANRIVVFLPSIGWSNSLVQRPHHLAAELARHGFLVFFDCSGSLVDHFAGFIEISKNLWTYNGPKGVLDTIERPILWTLTYNAGLTERWQEPTIVYDWIDDLSVFPYNQSWLQKNHERMLARADVVLCVARNLLDQARESRPDTLFVQNGVEYARFSAPSNPVGLDFRFREMVDEGRPVVGYYGAVASWFDIDLLTEVAELRPDWSFVIIGHTLDDAPSLKPLEEKSNVLVLPAQKYESLPNYLAQFAVATIPFKINRITEATSPLKLYEYFAGGKPVISTPLPECQSYDEVLVVETAEQFSQALDIAMESSRDVEFQKRLSSLGRENSWTRRVETVVSALSREPEVRAATSDVLKVTESQSNSDPEVEELEEPDVESNQLAQKFRRFKTQDNHQFFEGLTRHFSGLESDPSLPTLFEYAVTCNERGRALAQLMKPYVVLDGKHYLDIGCTYGANLVAFAEEGAIVTGIEKDQSLLHLAEYNLMDRGIDGHLLVRDTRCASELTRLREKVDVITCHDALEHADDLQLLLCNISSTLNEGGIAYFEIPNRYHPRHVLQDRHHQLFGITLLDDSEAREYSSLHAPGLRNRMPHYLDLDQCRELFEHAGMQLAVMDETLQGFDMASVLRDVAELRAGANGELEKVPLPVRSHVKERLSTYLNGLENSTYVTSDQRTAFLLRYGARVWRVVGRKNVEQPDDSGRPSRGNRAGNIRSSMRDRFSDADALGKGEHAGEGAVRRRSGMSLGNLWYRGTCNVCGHFTRFFYDDKSLYRGSLYCDECITTSRYRSIARGILKAIREISGIEAASLAELRTAAKNISLKIYDTQVPFYYENCCYPIPDLLSKCPGIEVETSIYRPGKRPGTKLGRNVSNQNLEKLTFPDNSFDIMITSDVMEHVRLDDRAHQEIRRVLKPGGIYLFTVPHFRDRTETLVRVKVVDPSDPSRDEFLMEKEYHGDANSKDNRALTYRAYGTDIDEHLNALGFDVEYGKEDLPQVGIMNTELFYCRLSK